MKTSTSTPRLCLSRALVASILSLGAALGPACHVPTLAQDAAPATSPVPADAPFAPEINAFAQSDKKQMPPQEAVLFLGSSTIRMWETLARDFAEIPVINRGFGGSTIAQSTRYADRIVIPYKPRMIVFFAGTNDLDSGNKSPLQVLVDFAAFADKIHGSLPETRIVYLSINPTVARWKQQSAVLEANHLIEKFIFQTGTKTRKLSFIDTHSQLLSADGQPQPALLRADGLHLNEEGYKVYTSIVKPRVLALAALDGVPRLDAAGR